MCVGLEDAGSGARSWESDRVALRSRWGSRVAGWGWFSLGLACRFVVAGVVHGADDAGCTVR